MSDLYFLLVYADDLPSLLLLKTMLFASDATVYASSSPLPDLVRLLLTMNSIYLHIGLMQDGH